MRSFLSLTIAVGVFAVGCGSMAQPSVDDIVDRMVEAQESTEPIHSTSVMTMTFSAEGSAESGMPGGATIVVDTEQWSTGPERMRVEYDMRMEFDDPQMTAMLQEQMPDLGGMVVRSGDTMWMYMDGVNAYAEMNAAEFEQDVPSTQNAAVMMRQMITDLLQNFDITFEGREEVAGVNTYRIHATPRTDVESSGLLGMDGVNIADATLWIDPDTWQPLKMHAAISEDIDEFAAGQGIDTEGADLPTIDFEIDMLVTELESGVDIPAETFEFEPPEGAQLIDPALMEQASPALGR